MNTQIRFDDGGAYERYMGKWSQLVGDAFIDWLAPAPNLRWLDVGCGNGAFTESLLQRCAPRLVHGVDPSEGQLNYARTRLAARGAQFTKADAMALPFEANTFDAAVMPLVIFFVPEPARGVAEMARVVCPGGSVSAYAWDLAGGGFPYESLHAEMRELGTPALTPPSPDASRLENLKALWTSAGLTQVETREITVQRSFVDFEDYWATVRGGPSVGQGLAAITPEKIALLQARMRAHLPTDTTGRISYSARANAVKGRVPA